MPWKTMVLAALLCTGGAVFAKGNPAPEPADKAAAGFARVDQTVDLNRQQAVYVVGTAHLDTQWRWTIQDTIRSFIPATFRHNFERFESAPNYVFSFEGAFRYMLCKEYYPEDYERLKGYIADGRWRVAGSWVDACDVNVPSPESLVRQALYGNGFFRREFGKTSCDVFLPDCFGFGYALPSVAAHCGLKGFSSQKLTWGSAYGIPFDVGLWEGVDGSTIVAALRAGGYTRSVPESLKGWLPGDGAPATYRYHGVGDRGGAPREASVQTLERHIAATATNPTLRVVSAGSDQLFRDLERAPERRAKLPRYQGELLMSTHGTGCYTSQGAMKRWNRRNEQLADAAERAAVAADWLGALPYPREALADAWVRFLWHQFHDDLTGTSIPAAYRFSWNDELLSLNRFTQVLSASIRAVAAGMDTRAEGVPLVVYNPLGIDREDVVEARLAFDGAAPSAVRVFGPDGREVPSQSAPAPDGKGLAVRFLAPVPSVGFAVFDVRAAREPCAADTGLAVTERSLENRRYRVTLDDAGDLAGIFDKQLGKELLRAPHRLVLLKDTSRRWPQWEVLYEDVMAKPIGQVGGPATFEIVERGPARVALRVRRELDGSSFVQTIRLAAGAGDRVEVDTAIEWGLHALLKADFSLTSANTNATYDLGLGTIQRPLNRPKLYEVPAQQWADVTAPDGSYGVAVLSDAKYGWDRPAADRLRLTLLHTPEACGWVDMGSHRMGYAVVGHAGDWRETVPWQAARLNQPLIAARTVPHQGSLGRSFSLLRVSSPAVMVKALKKAEESDAYVTRLQELHGAATGPVEVTWPADLRGVVERYGDETARGDVPPPRATGRAMRLRLGPYQPRTVAVQLARPAAGVAPIESTPVALPFDLDGVSSNANRTDGDFDGKGHTIPAELLPRELTVDGVRLAFGATDDGAKNALTCTGQEIALPAGDANAVYLLAASVADDADCTFQTAAVRQQVTVPAWDGFVGQWDRLPERGFIKRQPVGWVGTHRHERRGDGSGADEPYVFCYLFAFRLELPPGARSIRLPDAPNVRLLAMSAVKDPLPPCALAQTLYE